LCWSGYTCGQQSGEDGDGGKKKKRKVPPLPLELSSLTDCDRSKFDLVLEIDKTHRSATFGQEFLVAKLVRVPSTNGEVDDPPTVFDLGAVTVDNLRKLCTNIGVSNAGLLSKFNCRKELQSTFGTRNPCRILASDPPHTRRELQVVCAVL
jgi:hypothetical protein